jgi:aerobic carbon-monoxide dehydrogenase small subunit
MGKFAITLMVDAARRELLVEARTLLVQAIREQLRITGPHVGCDSGRCGACTVLVDGAATKSCMVLAVQADGATITTAAGLGKHGELHPLQAAFREFHALQCGYCTPGMLCAAADLLTRNPNPSDREVREALRGNLCRCTGYQHIVEAVLNAAKGYSSPANAEQA